MRNRAFHRVLLAIILLVGVAFGQITPSQDAYINTASPGTNFGSATTLSVVSPSQTAFIQFDLSSIPAGYTSASIAKATLKLYVSSVTTAGSFNVDFVNGGWSEKTLTANNAPALGTTIAPSVSLAKANAHDYVLIDVTSAVGAWLDGTQSNDGIALVANSPLSATVESKENIKESQPAELDVVFASGGGTITGITTAAGSGLTGGTNSGVANLSLLTSCASGQVLSWNGSAWVCTTVGTGTVTSVGLSAPAADFTITGSPVTSSGTLGLNWTVAPTSANTANAIVKRDSTGSFNANNITASGQIVVNNGSLLNPILSQASAANAAAIVGTAAGTGVTNGVRGSSVSSGAGSSGVTGIDGNTTSGNYTAGVSGYTVNPSGVGVIGSGKTLSNVGNTYLGTAAAGVWADNANFGLVATSDLNAVVAYNNSTAATIFSQNDTTSASGYLLYATAPNVNSNGNPATCTITTHADLGCNGNLKGDGALRVGQDATQPNIANGFVKALVFIDPTSGITRCFNSQLSEPAGSTPPCGFTYTRIDVGSYSVDFGFDVSSRFPQLTTQNCGHPYTNVFFDNVKNSPILNISLWFQTADGSLHGADDCVSLAVF